MAGRVVHFDTKEIQKALRRYENKIENLPMDVLGQLLITATDDMFQSEGGKGTDGIWSPLAESTIARRPNRAGGQLLQDTGAMAAVQISEIQELSVEIAAAPAYSKFHLDGTTRMPKRDFFALNFDEVLDELGDATLEEMGR